MAGSSKPVQKYYRKVDEANAALALRWRAITNHMRLGLSAPIATSAMLLRTYEPPKDYVGEDGKKHRKPIRALYGFGDSARERFESDAAQYERFGIPSSRWDRHRERVSGSLGWPNSGRRRSCSSLVLPDRPAVDLPTTARGRRVLGQWILGGGAAPGCRAIRA